MAWCSTAVFVKIDVDIVNQPANLSPAFSWLRYVEENPFELLPCVHHALCCRDDQFCYRSGNMPLCGMSH
jgi:hypothetical protein